MKNYQRVSGWIGVLLKILSQILKLALLVLEIWKRIKDS